MALYLYNEAEQFSSFPSLNPEDRLVIGPEAFIDASFPDSLSAFRLLESNRVDVYGFVIAARSVFFDTSGGGGANEIRVHSEGVLYAGGTVVDLVGPANRVANAGSISGEVGVSIVDDFAAVARTHSGTPA